MKIYICPECGQFREASRRKEVICYRCENEVYFNMTKEEREEYSKSWLYIHECLHKKKN